MTNRDLSVHLLYQPIPEHVNKSKTDKLVKFIEFIVTVYIKTTKTRQVSIFSIQISNLICHVLTVRQGKIISFKVNF